MNFNRFNIQVSLRVVLIVITAMFFVYILSQDDKIMVSIISALLIILQTILLINYIKNLNRKLTQFLIRAKGNDTTSLVYDQAIENTFKGIHLSVDKINQEIQHIRIDHEQRMHYLDTVVNHVGTGIIAYDETGKIEIFNPEAQRIFKLDKTYNLQRLNLVSEGLEQILRNMPLNETRVLKIPVESEIMHLSTKATQLKIGQKLITIITLLDVKLQLEAHELDSWQKLIRVLTHEIMNSITPITTLSASIRRYLKKEDKIKKAEDLNDQIIEDIILNADVIEDRGKSLISFVNVYKDLTQIPKLKITEFSVLELLDRTYQFYKTELDQQKVNLTINCAEQLIMSADSSLIEQMLINLIKNAVEALKDKDPKKIFLRANSKGNGEIIIQVEDNGSGIQIEEQEKIFIPFYTSKENGSGIGLSLSRQIMQLHKGSISFQSIPDNYTVFTMSF